MIARVRQSLNGASRQTWFAVATTLLAALSGLFGSLYAADIQRAFPFDLWPFPIGGLSWRAIVFWGSLALFAFMFFFRQEGDDQERLKLIGTAQEVLRLQQTLPPAAFRNRFAEASSLVLEGLGQVAPRSPTTRNPPDLAAVVRQILRAILGLALVYDGHTADASAPLYAANVMLFVPRDGTAKGFPEELLRRLQFFPRDGDPAKLRGILALEHALSATTDSNVRRGEPDPRVAPIALPIPETEFVQSQAKRWRVLPGAPMAFVRAEIDGYEDARSLHRWCSTDGDFSDDVRAEVQRYFEGPGMGSRSFVSRPLYRKVGTTQTPIGVLNLHSDQTGILGPLPDKRAIFFAMLTPLVHDLMQTIVWYADATQKGQSS